MDKSAWSSRTNSSDAYNRAGGRRKWNKRRLALANMRRAHLAELLDEARPGRGFASEAARKLGVNRSTICRDLQALRMPEPIRITYHLNKEGQVISNPMTYQIRKLLADY